MSNDLPEVLQIAAISLECLATRLRADQSRPLPAYITPEVRAIVQNLKREIPGLYPASNQTMADDRLQRSLDFSQRGKHRHALLTAMDGVTYAIYDTRLWQQLATSCFCLGRLDLAIDLIQFVGWIDPRQAMHKPNRESTRSRPEE